VRSWDKDDLSGDHLRLFPAFPKRRAGGGRSPSGPGLPPPPEPPDLPRTVGETEAEERDGAGPRSSRKWQICEQNPSGPELQQLCAPAPPPPRAASRGSHRSCLTALPPPVLSLLRPAFPVSGRLALGVVPFRRGFSADSSVCRLGF
jgi:hypothetical protein